MPTPEDTWIDELLYIGAVVGRQSVSLPSSTSPPAFWPIPTRGNNRAIEKEKPAAAQRDGLFYLTIPAGKDATGQ